MTYEQKVSEILKDASTSEWLKEAIIRLHNRDIFDVLNDIEVMQELFLLRFEDAKMRWEALGAAS